MKYDVSLLIFCSISKTAYTHIPFLFLELKYVSLHEAQHQISRMERMGIFFTLKCEEKPVRPRLEIDF